MTFSRPSFSRLRPFLVLAGICLLGISGCKKQAEQTPEVAVSVQAVHPVIAPLSDEIHADAILAPLAQAALTPRISAPIRAFYVQRGSHVHKGELLALLEDRDLRGNALDTAGNLASAKGAYATATQSTIPAALQKAELDVDQARANLKLADVTVQERKRLLQQGAISGREVDTAETAEVQAQASYDLATKHLEAVRKTIDAADLQVARGQLTSAEGRYQSAEAQASYAQLRSPIDGVVTERSLFAGETATAGSPVLTVMDTTFLLAKLHLAQASAQELHLGDSAEIDIPGAANPVSAAVTLISPALDPGSTTIEVWLRLENKDGSLKVGTPVHATITGRTAASAMQIPTSALLPGANGGSTVMVVGGDSAAHTRAVSVGIRTAEKAQILSGLSVTDEVIVEGSYGLDDGTPVTLDGAKQKGEGAN